MNIKLANKISDNEFKFSFDGIYYTILDKGEKYELYQNNNKFTCNQKALDKIYSYLEDEYIVYVQKIINAINEMDQILGE